MDTDPHAVIVDGNNVMGARADGWWRDRVGAARRLTAQVEALARPDGPQWTVVFDGRRPGDASEPMRVAVVHAADSGDDTADDRIVALVAALPDPTAALVYTSDRELQRRAAALGSRVEGALALLQRIDAAER